MIDDRRDWDYADQMEGQPSPQSESDVLRAELAAALAEVERLRAQWESIPWAALDALMRWGLRAYLPGTEQPALPVVTAWLAANAPKQETQP